MTIAAANNNNPQLSVPFQGFIFENSPIGTIPRNSDGSNLLRISVTDPDLVGLSWLEVLPKKVNTCFSKLYSQDPVLKRGLWIKSNYTFDCSILFSLCSSKAVKLMITRIWYPLGAKFGLT